MARIKGLRALNRAVTKELSVFGIHKAICSTDYEYQFDTHDVYFQLNADCIEDIWFAKFVEQEFKFHVEHDFVMALLHEVGHHKTYFDLEDEVIDFCIDEKDRIAKAMTTANAKESERLEFEYFNLTDEYVATAWAVEYAKEHPKHIERMWRNLCKAFNTFYKKNKIEG